MDETWSIQTYSAGTFDFPPYRVRVGQGMDVVLYVGRDFKGLLETFRLHGIQAKATRLDLDIPEMLSATPLLTSP